MRVNLGPRGRRHCVWFHNSYSTILKPNGSLRQQSQREKNHFVKVSECNHLSWSIVSGQWFCFSQKLIQLSLTYLDQGEAFSSHLELKEKKEAWSSKKSLKWKAVTTPKALLIVEESLGKTLKGLFSPWLSHIVEICDPQHQNTLLLS